MATGTGMTDDTAERGIEDDDGENAKRHHVEIDLPPREVHLRGAIITDADWKLIVEGRALPSGLPGKGRNPRAPQR